MPDGTQIDPRQLAAQMAGSPAMPAGGRQAILAMLQASAPPQPSGAEQLAAALSGAAGQAGTMLGDAYGAGKEMAGNAMGGIQESFQTPGMPGSRAMHQVQEALHLPGDMLRNVQEDVARAGGVGGALKSLFGGGEAEAPAGPSTVEELDAEIMRLIEQRQAMAGGGGDTAITPEEVERLKALQGKYGGAQ